MSTINKTSVLSRTCQPPCEDVARYRTWSPPAYTATCFQSRACLRHVYTKGPISGWTDGVDLEVVCIDEDSLAFVTPLPDIDVAVVVEVNAL
jgi:hypothetical protein